MNDIKYTIKRSSRKTVGIYIKPNGSVEVRAPYSISDKVIAEFVDSKRDWIASHIEKIAEHAANSEVTALDFGSKILLRGVEYPIVAGDSNIARFDGSRFILPQSLPCDEFPRVLGELYRIMAKDYIPSRVKHYAEIMKLTPSDVKINSAKTRWGSCSGKNSLNFSYFVMMADDRLIDSVVVHELSHIAHHDHSAKFWELVHRTMPDYDKSAEALKRLSERIVREGWK